MQQLSGQPQGSVTRTQLGQQGEGRHRVCSFESLFRRLQALEAIPQGSQADEVAINPCQRDAVRTPPRRHLAERGFALCIADDLQCEAPPPQAADQACPEVSNLCPVLLFLEALVPTQQGRQQRERRCGCLWQDSLVLVTRLSKSLGGDCPTQVHALEPHCFAPHHQATPPIVQESGIARPSPREVVCIQREALLHYAQFPPTSGAMLGELELIHFDGMRLPLNTHICDSVSCLQGVERLRRPAVASRHEQFAARLRHDTLLEHS